MSHSGTALLLLLSITATCAVANESPLIVAARDRQARYKTFELEWKRTHFFRKGSVSDEARGIFGGKTVIPDRDTTIESTNSLIVDGTKIRYTNNHPTWFLPKGVLDYPTTISTFDGGNSASYYPLGISGKHDSLGIIFGELSAVSPRNVGLMPFTTHYRGLLSMFTYRRLEQFKRTINTIEIDKTRCEEYRSGQGDEFWVFWVDPTAQHVIRRMQYQKLGRIMEQLEIRHQKDDQGNYHPKSWTWNRFSDMGVTREANTFQILNRTVNIDQPAALFVANFPVGTTVEDQRLKKTYKLEADGSKTALTPGGKPIGPLPSETSWFWRNKWFLLATSLVLIWLVVWRVRRKT